jgi:hypothetical protein
MLAKVRMPVEKSIENLVGKFDEIICGLLLFKSTIDIVAFQFVSLIKVKILAFDTNLTNERNLLAVKD